MVVFEEGGVAVDVAAKALAKDEFGVGNVKGRMDGCAFGVLDDVFGPESLGTVGGIDDLIGLLIVGCGEGDVFGWVPVLGEDDVVKPFCEGVDDRDYGVAVFDRQCAVGHEVILDVDDQKRILRA